MSTRLSLCSLCRGITLDALISINGYSHHASYQALQTCAEQCSLCGILKCALQQGEGVTETLQQRESQQQISLGASDGGYMGLGIARNLTNLDIHVGQERYARLQLYAAADDPAASSGAVAGRQISSRPDSDANFKLIRDWFRECLTRHRYCPVHDHSTGGSSAPSLPTRVIDVTYDNPRLAEPKDAFGLYATLSHCWGKSKAVVTDKSTLSERKKGIEFQLLPKTFQDAIVVTRRLGYRYLWIDSLCIVQDSQTDWQREASMMSNYYGQAHLTISATSADGDHVGFLNARSRTSSPVELTLTLPNGDIGKIFVALGPPNAVTSAFYRNVEQSPINKRAWILQERALSPRILHYGREQIFWECRSFELSEGGSVRSRGLSGLQRGFGSNLWLTDTRFGPSTSDERHKIDQIRYEWNSLVHEYTKRILTKPSDKLPAISGLAHNVPAEFRSKYCAGLWESGIRHDLDWVARKPSQSVDDYIAPSWSWAATSSPVSFTDERSLKKKTAIFEIEDVHVGLLGEDEYGEIKSASLTLHGHLLSVHVTQRPFRFRDREENETSDMHKGGAVRSSEVEVTDIAGRAVGWVAPDRSCPAPDVLSCLTLYHCRDKYDEEYYSAIFLESLELESSPQRFRRFGRGSVWDISIEETDKQPLILV